MTIPKQGEECRGLKLVPGNQLCMFGGALPPQQLPTYKSELAYLKIESAYEIMKSETISAIY